MTARRLIALAALAVGVAAVGIAARATLDTPRGAALPPAHPPVTIAAAGRADQRAVTALRRAAACPAPPRRATVGCGRITVVRQETLPTATGCRVEVIATLTRDHRPVPITATVTLTAVDGHWQVEAVSS